MKNLIGAFLAITLVFSALVLPPGKVYAQVNTQNTAALEMQLNTLQKELIVLLNKKIVMMKAEIITILENRLKAAQMQLIGLLQKGVAILQAELDAKTK